MGLYAPGNPVMAENLEPHSKPASVEARKKVRLFDIQVIRLIGHDMT